MQMLRKLYPKIQTGEISRQDALRVFGRTWKALYDKASTLGLKTRAESENLDEEFYKTLVGRLKI